MKAKPTKNYRIKNTADLNLSKRKPNIKQKMQSKLPLFLESEGLAVATGVGHVVIFQNPRLAK